MSNTDKLREIAERELNKRIVGILMAHGVNSIDAFNSTPDLTALISEDYYPKKFVEWATNNAECDGDGKWYVYSIAAIIDSPKVYKYETALLTTDELFNYWKENEQ